MSTLAATGRYAHYLGRFAVDAIAGFWRQPNRTNTLLLVRPDGIGDFIVWLASLPALLEQTKAERIVLVANRLFEELADRLGWFDEVIGIDVRRYQNDLRYRYRTSRRLREIGAQIAVQPVLSRSFWLGDAIIRASAAKDRVGAAGNSTLMRSWQQRMARRWYTRLIPVNLDKLTEFGRNADFQNQLGVQETTSQQLKIPTVSDLPRKLRSTDRYFVIFPGAGSHKRIWPAKRWAEVTRQIAEYSGLRPVICGGPGDAAMAAEIVDGAGVGKAFSLAGETSLSELVEVIRAARFLIGNETSAVHIAAAVGTPSVCLLGGGHFGRFVPYPKGVSEAPPVPVFSKMDCFGCNWQCTQPHEAGGPTPCITGITVDQVVDAVRSTVAKEKRHVVEAH